MSRSPPRSAEGIAVGVVGDNPRSMWPSGAYFLGLPLFFFPAAAESILNPDERRPTGEDPSNGGEFIESIAVEAAEEEAAEGGGAMTELKGKRGLGLIIEAAAA